MTIDHKIDEILECVRNIEARNRPVAEDMCASIRWIIEEIPEGRGVPFLDDAVRQIVAALQQAQAKASMLDTLRQDQEAAIAALGRSLVVAKFDVDFKHEQWQAAVGLGQADRERTTTHRGRSARSARRHRSRRTRYDRSLCAVDRHEEDPERATRVACRRQAREVPRRRSRAPQ
jgi:hypothetical protein